MVSDAFQLKLLIPRPDLDSLLMLSEENYNMELSHPISEGSGYHWDQQTNC
jgi:hypothetical protein